jgi:hypothetical protein
VLFITRYEWIHKLQTLFFSLKTLETMSCKEAGECLQARESTREIVLGACECICMGCFDRLRVVLVKHVAIILVIDYVSTNSRSYDLYYRKNTASSIKTDCQGSIASQYSRQIMTRLSPKIKIIFIGMYHVMLLSLSVDRPPIISIITDHFHI